MTIIKIHKKNMSRQNTPPQPLATNYDYATIPSVRHSEVLGGIW